MLLEVLASPPGTGKTSRCIEIFKSEILKSRAGIDSRCFFVLPSREHADRIQNLILKKGVVGLFNAHILTINDLTARLLGKSAGLHPTDSIRKTVIQRILEDPALNFRYFAEVKGFAGFREFLVDTIKEFKANLLSAAEFKKRCRRLRGQEAFQLKAADFIAVLKRYEETLEDLGLSEPEDDIVRLVQNKKKDASIDVVVFDGFYHFTRAQNELIRYLSTRARRSVVTLTLPASGEERSPLFEFPRKTLASLLQIGFKTVPPLLQNYRSSDPALLHLEKNLFAARPEVFKAPQESLRVLEAPSARGEVECIAREIKRLYRGEEPRLHYSDICVILRGVGSYEPLIHAVFSAAGIPVQVHERKKLIQHGFAAALYRLFALTAENWRREDLISFLKSGYFSETARMEDALALESLAAAENVLEGRENWERLADLEGATEGARAILKWALAVEAGFLGANNASGFTSLLKDFMRCYFRVNAGDEAATAAFTAIESMLDSARAYYEGGVERAFSARAFIGEFRQSLESGLYSLKPRGKNRVQVYDVIMALPKEYKVVFMAGLVEKAFPPAAQEDPLFKDAERRLLNAGGEVLEERLPRAAGERYFFYMGVTRAKNRLYLSYPAAHGDGKAVLPSPFIEEATRCFAETPHLKMDPGRILRLPEEWESENEVTQGLSRLAFQTDGNTVPAVLPTLYGEWMRRPAFRRIVETGLRGDAARLEDAGVLEYFGSMQGPFSATKLETFATCAFKYFSNRVLWLAEPEEGREFLEMGNLLHKVLEDFYTALPAESRRDSKFWNEDARVVEELEKKLTALIEERHAFRGQPLYRRKVFFGVMREALAAFAEQEKELAAERSGFPEHFELDFKHLKIPGVGGDVILDGKIDRVDIFDGGKKALIVDYKLSKRAVTLRNKLSKGLEIQLPVYMLAVKRLLGLELVGAELRFLREGKKEGLYLESAREALGLGREKTLEDRELEEVFLKTEELVRDSVRRLQAGDISIRSKSCEHCKYTPVCRFETWKEVYRED